MAFYIGLALSLTIAAFVAAITGTGGAALYTPIQVFFDIDIHQAAATSLFLCMVLSISAGRIYHRAGKIDWKLAALLVVFSTAGGFAGGYFSKFIPSTILSIILTALVSMAGIISLTPDKRGGGHCAKHSKTHEVTREGLSPTWRRNTGGEAYTINLLLAIPLSLIAGALSGMVGVAGGVLMIPLMSVVLSVPIDIAIASSMFIVGITALGGFTGHLMVGHWEWKPSLTLTPGVFIGAWLGAHSMLKIKREYLKKIFGILMLIIAVLLIAKMANTQFQFTPSSPSARCPPGGVLERDVCPSRLASTCVNR